MCVGGGGGGLLTETYSERGQTSKMDGAFCKTG